MMVSPTALQTTLAQESLACGVVDDIGYPFANVSRTATNAFYVRFPFGNDRPDYGFHAGEDWFAARGGSLGEPVQAIANGLVTLSAETGWGVDKGVVIIEHALPDGSIIYSLYGHMEALNGHVFPEQGSCLERGDVVGAIGNPRSRPHLHFEIRHMWPTFTGFGYSERPPELEGWENPTAYIVNWQAWLNPAYRWHAVTREPMTALPALDGSGTIYVATEGFVQTYGTDAELKYRYALDTDEVISQWSALDFGALAFTTQGDLWGFKNDLTPGGVLSPGGQSEDFIDAGELLLLNSSAGRLRIFNRNLTQIGQLEDVDGVSDVAVGEQVVALASGGLAPQLLLLTPNGQLLQRASLRGSADVTPAADGGVLVRTRRALWHVSAQAEWTFVSDQFEVTPSSSALSSDGWGSIYLFSGRNDSRLTSFALDGQMRWQTSLDVLISGGPVMAVGGGCGLYLGSSDGYLTAVNTATGQIGETLQIYAGALSGEAAWLTVGGDEMVYFAVGGNQIIALDGRTLVGLPAGTPCVNPY